MTHLPEQELNDPTEAYCTQCEGYHDLESDCLPSEWELADMKRKEAIEDNVELE